MDIRIWMAALTMATSAGLTSIHAAAAENACSGDMAALRAQVMARIHGENRAALQRQLRETQSAMREQARQSFLAQQPAPSSGRSSAKSAP